MCNAAWVYVYSVHQYWEYGSGSWIHMLNPQVEHTWNCPSRFNTIEFKFWYSEIGYWFVIQCWNIVLFRCKEGFTGYKCSVITDMALASQFIVNQGSTSDTSLIIGTLLPLCLLGLMFGLCGLGAAACRRKRKKTLLVRHVQDCEEEEEEPPPRSFRTYQMWSPVFA